MALSRRTVLAATALGPLVVAAVGRPAFATGELPAIRPRADWAGSLRPRGPLEVEDDVRFLLVHHTQTPNTDTPAGVVERLRSVFRFHTSAERGWNDVAYNFFVDRFGTIWEGRDGSLTRAVKGDATGGSQGHALLCCFVGDHTAQPPTDAAWAAMVSLLAWLAAREGLSLEGPTTFTSRGSTKWRKGSQVTTAQVAAHRDMSATACPGDALYPLVAGRLLPEARQRLVGAAAPEPSAPPMPSAMPEASVSPTPTATPATTPEGKPAQAWDGWPGGVWPWVTGATLVTGGAAALMAARRRSEKEAPGQDRAADDQHDEQPDEEPTDRG